MVLTSPEVCPCSKLALRCTAYPQQCRLSFIENHIQSPRALVFFFWLTPFPRCTPPRPTQSNPSRECCRSRAAQLRPNRPQQKGPTAITNIAAVMDDLKARSIPRSLGEFLVAFTDSKLGVSIFISSWRDKSVHHCSLLNLNPTQNGLRNVSRSQPPQASAIRLRQHNSENSISVIDEVSQTSSSTSGRFYRPCLGILFWVWKFITFPRPCVIEADRRRFIQDFLWARNWSSGE